MLLGASWKTFHGKSSTEISKKIFDGISCGIFQGITMEHDGSPWSFHTFSTKWNCHGKRFHGNSAGFHVMKYFMEFP